MTVLDDYFKALGKKSAAARMKNMTMAGALLRLHSWPDLVG